LTGQNSKVSNAVAVGRQHLDVNHHFRFGLVDVANNLSREKQLVGRIANHDRVLRVHLLEAPQIEELAQSRHDFGKVLRRESVGKVKRPHDLVFQILPFLRIIGRHENHARRNRLPEGLALERHCFERLLQRDVWQFGRYPARSEIRIEDNAEPRQLRYGFEHHARVVRHLQIDWFARYRLQRGRLGHQGFIGRGIGVYHLRRIIRALGPNQIQRSLDFLFSGGIGRVYRLGLLKLGQRELQIALLKRFLALLNVELSVLKAHVRVPELVLRVRRVGAQCAFVVY